jgi:AcrB/AcrD/AcrF family
LDKIVPLTILLIFIILYSMFRSFKWATLIMLNVMLARVGGLLALLVTHTNFSVSSGVRQCDAPEIVLAMHALRGLDRRAADERSEIQWQEKALADSWADPSSTRAS